MTITYQGVFPLPFKCDKNTIVLETFHLAQQDSSRMLPWCLVFTKARPRQTPFGEPRPTCFTPASNVRRLQGLVTCMHTWICSVQVPQSALNAKRTHDRNVKKNGKKLICAKWRRADKITWFLSYFILILFYFIVIYFTFYFLLFVFAHAQNR